MSVCIQGSKKKDYHVPALCNSSLLDLFSAVAKLQQANQIVVLS